MVEIDDAVFRILGEVLEKLKVANNIAAKSGQVNVQRSIEHMRGHLEVMLASVDSFPSLPEDRKRAGTGDAP